MNSTKKLDRQIYFVTQDIKKMVNFNYSIPIWRCKKSPLSTWSVKKGTPGIPHNNIQVKEKQRWLHREKEKNVRSRGRSFFIESIQGIMLTLAPFLWFIPHLRSSSYWQTGEVHQYTLPCASKGEKGQWERSKARGKWAGRALKKIFSQGGRLTRQTSVKDEADALCLWKLNLIEPNRAGVFGELSEIFEQSWSLNCVITRMILSRIE